MPLPGQLLQMRARREGQPQRHARAVHHLACMQVQGAAQEGQLIPHEGQQLRGAAGEVHGQEATLADAAADRRRGDVAALVRRSKTGNAQHRSQTASLSVPCVEHGHVGSRIIPGRTGHAHRRDLLITHEGRQLLEALGKLTHMNENGLGLPEAPLALRDGQELPAGRQDLPCRRHGSDGGGVAAGIHANDNFFQIHHC